MLYLAHRPILTYNFPGTRLYLKTRCQGHKNRWSASISVQISHDDNLDLSKLLMGFIQIANHICPDASLYLRANITR